MGLPLRIATNSEPVLAEAARIWSPYPQLFHQTGVRLKIAATPGGSLPGTCAGTPRAGTLVLDGGGSRKLRER